MTLLELLGTDSRAAERKRMYGVVVGTVRDIRDPIGLGRVKVNFPWLGEEAEAVAASAEEDRAHSTWARIATPMAGKGRGIYFIPEVDDEVLVAFEGGDIDLPIVVGSLWNSDDKPPQQMDDAGGNHVRSITSRSGHRIVLDDLDDKPSILIADQSGENSIFIDSANSAMEIKVKGDLRIQVEGQISITSKGKVEINADQDIVLDTKANLGLKAAAIGKLEATGPLTIESKALTEVKGAPVKLN